MGCQGTPLLLEQVLGPQATKGPHCSWSKFHLQTHSWATLPYSTTFSSVLPGQPLNLSSLLIYKMKWNSPTLQSYKENGYVSTAGMPAMPHMEQTHVSLGSTVITSSTPTPKHLTGHIWAALNELLCPQPMSAPTEKESKPASLSLGSPSHGQG